MYQVPLKFILAWFLIMSITYSVTALMYIDTTEPEIPEAEEPPENAWDLVLNALGWIFDFFIGLFRVAFFILPNVPLEITLALNIIIQPFNIIFFMGIYPILADFIDKVLAFFEAITPDWL